jgi:hypothetical protein
MSNISPNIRASCNGVLPLLTLGTCFQNADAVDSTTKIKYNTTQMLNYTTSGGTYIDPFAVAEIEGVPDCSPYETADPTYFVCGTGPTGNGNMWCYPIPTSYIKAAGANEATFSVGAYKNTYSQSQDTASNVCTDARGLGFKNIYAKKTWSGRKSYTSPDYAKESDWDWCCNGGSTVDLRSNDPTKYLTITANALYQRDETILGEVSQSEVTYIDCDDIEQTAACNYYPDEHITTLVGTADVTSTVSRYGQVTNTCASASSGNFAEGCFDDPDCIQAQQEQYANNALNLAAAIANGDWRNLITTWCANMNGGGGFIDESNCNPDVVTHNGDGSWHVEWHSGINTQPDGSSCTSSLADEEVDGTYGFCYGPIATEKKLYYEMTITPTSLNVKKYGQKVTYPACPNGDTKYEWVVWSDYTVTFSATALYMSDVAQENTVSINWSRIITQEVTAALSNPYTAADVYNDLVNNLLSKWDFGKDMVWREDSDKTKGPLVSRDETTDAPYIGNCTSSATYTGRIDGAPGPVGVDKVWNPAHKNYCVCAGLYDPSNFIFYVESRGQWSTDGCHEPRATQWLNYYESNNMPDGAFVGSNFFYTFPASSTGPTPVLMADDILYACKYAEAIYPKQSFNYASPCSEGRLQLSESSDRCISGVAGNILTLAPAGPDVLIQTGKTMYVCGTAELDGLWKGTTDTGHQITLTEPRIASSSQFPSLPITNCGTSLVAELKYPSSNYAICGRIGISSISSGSAGGIVTCSLDTPTYLITGDSINVVNAGFLNGTRTVNVIDNANISFGVAGGQTYTGGGQIYSSFAVDWKWNDTTSKNDFTARIWLYTYRDVGEYLRISASNALNLGTANCIGDIPSGYSSTNTANPRYHQSECGISQNVLQMSCSTLCLPYNPCSTVVAYFSPNSESISGSSRNIGWPAPVQMDSIYGGIYWQGAIVQSMNDPYFITPPTPCGWGGAWTEDGGGCASDTGVIKYYAARNVYEARCSVPDGAPNLIDVHIGCIQTDDIGGGSCPDGNICSGPTAPSTFPAAAGCAPYLVNIYTNPWVLLLAKESCVCSVGRFASNYAANGISAGPTCDVVPPP